MGTYSTLNTKPRSLKYSDFTGVIWSATICSGGHTSVQMFSVYLISLAPNAGVQWIKGTSAYSFNLACWLSTLYTYPTQLNKWKSWSTFADYSMDNDRFWNIIIGCRNHTAWFCNHTTWKTSLYWRWQYIWYCYNMRHLYDAQRIMCISLAGIWPTS